MTPFYVLLSLFEAEYEEGLEPEKLMKDITEYLQNNISKYTIERRGKEVVFIWFENEEDMNTTNNFLYDHTNEFRSRRDKNQHKKTTKLKHTKVGDKIGITKNSPESSFYFGVGDTGTVYAIDGNCVSVRFDKSPTFVRESGTWDISNDDAYPYSFAEWEILEGTADILDAVVSPENWRKDSIFCNCPICYALHHKDNS